MVEIAISTAECPVDVFYMDFGFSAADPLKGIALAVLPDGWIRVWKDSDGALDPDGCYQGWLMMPKDVARVSDGFPDRWKDE